jgi:hypothetical protein
VKSFWAVLLKNISSIAFVQSASWFCVIRHDTKQKTGGKVTGNLCEGSILILQQNSALFSWTQIRSAKCWGIKMDNCLGMWLLFHQSAGMDMCLLKSCQAVIWKGSKINRTVLAPRSSSGAIRICFGSTVLPSATFSPVVFKNRYPFSVSLTF